MEIKHMNHQLCKLSDVPAEGSILVPFFGREVHVYRIGRSYRAAANVCLHFGGPLECRNGQFVCPWHGASYDMGSGERLSGPAPKESKLMFLSTKEEDGTLYYVWGD